MLQRHFILYYASCVCNMYVHNIYTYTYLEKHRIARTNNALQYCVGKFWNGLIYIYLYCLVMHESNNNCQLKFPNKSFCFAGNKMNSIYLLQVQIHVFVNDEIEVEFIKLTDFQENYFIDSMKYKIHIYIDKKSRKKILIKYVSVFDMNK